MCAKNNAWSEEEKLNHLMCSLSDPANQLLWEVDADSILTSDDLVQKLRSRYGNSDQAAVYQMQLTTRKQKANEDLGSLVHDIRRLMSLAYEGPSTVHSENIAMRAFLDALTDKELALKVREKEPDTLQKAYRIAMRLEGYQRATNDSSGTFE